MSPKSRGRKQRRPKHRPHQQQRARVQAARDTVPPELLSMMLAAGKDMVRGEGPLEAEEIASALLGVWWGSGLIDADVEEVLGGAMVAEAARRRTAESLTLLTAVASVAHGRLAVEASTAAAGLEGAGVTGPTWLSKVGRVEPVAFYRSWDPSGDVISVIGLFTHEGDDPHAVSVLIDRNLGGLAKDGWTTHAGQEVVDRYQQEAAADNEMTVEEVDPAAARALVEAAFAVTDRALRHEPPVSDEIGSFRALVLARMRSLPTGDPQADPCPEDRRFHGDGADEEARRFLATPEVEALDRAVIVAGCVDVIVGYAEAYDEERLLRVSPVKAGAMLLEYLPVWAGLTASQVAVMPEVLRLWSRYAASRSGQPDPLLAETLAAIDQMEAEFATAATKDTVPEYLREEADGRDIWERLDNADRLDFALLVEPTGVFGMDSGSLEDDLHELAVLAHPEYDAVLAAGELGADPEDGEVSQGAHLALHDVVTSQLWHDDPPEVWQTALRLQLGDYDQHEIHHMLASAFVEPLHSSLAGQQPFDLDLYRASLAELPGSWEAQRPS